ncbi:MAG: hypothetical protein ACYSVY_25125, partial [Planctomycetota bacterium]
MFRVFGGVFALVLAMGPSAADAGVIHESATMGAAGQSNGVLLHSGQFLGSRFHVDATVEVNSIGGHLLSSEGTLFGAIVSLSGPDVFPSGRPFDSTTIASTTFTVGTPSVDFRTPLSATLPPGDYALIFGSGEFGAGGDGKMPANNPDIPEQASYIFWAGGAWWDADVFNYRNVRFVIAEGLCGDGALDSGEECDDGNSGSGDGCSGGCLIEECFACSGEPSSCAADDGAACDDGRLCTVDACDAGVCVGRPRDCDDGNACSTDSCDPALGCGHEPIPGCCSEDANCNDQDACNGMETCQGNTCVSGTPPDCDDGEVCTTDGCDPAVGCITTPVLDGTLCIDGDACNGDETCQSGVCTPGTAPDCDDGDSCTTDTCLPVSGCQHTPDPGCKACVTGADCSDGNPCTDDVCTDETCVNPPLGDGISCADGDACNGDETCQSGECMRGAPLSCDDATACTSDS